MWWYWLRRSRCRGFCVEHQVLVLVVVVDEDDLGGGTSLANPVMIVWWCLLRQISFFVVLVVNKETIISSITNSHNIYTQYTLLLALRLKSLHVRTHPWKDLIVVVDTTTPRDIEWCCCKSFLNDTFSHDLSLFSFTISWFLKESMVKQGYNFMIVPVLIYYYYYR